MGGIGCSGKFIARTEECAGVGIYSYPDELGEKELEGDVEEEITSIGIGRTALCLEPNW